MNRKIFNGLDPEAFKPVIRNQVQNLRQVGAQARLDRNFKRAHAADRQARRWEVVAFKLEKE